MKKILAAMLALCACTTNNFLVTAPDDGGGMSAAHGDGGASLEADAMLGQGAWAFDAADSESGDDDDGADGASVSDSGGDASLSADAAPGTADASTSFDAAVAVDAMVAADAAPTCATGSDCDHDGVCDDVDRCQWFDDFNDKDDNGYPDDCDSVMWSGRTAIPMTQQNVAGLSARFVVREIGSNTEISVIEVGVLPGMSFDVSVPMNPMFNYELNALRVSGPSRVYFETSWGQTSHSSRHVDWTFYSSRLMRLRVFGTNSGSGFEATGEARGYEPTMPDPGSP